MRRQVERHPVGGMIRLEAFMKGDCMALVDVEKKILDAFRKEFGAIADRFEIHGPLTVDEARNNQTPGIWHLGVYVWFKDVGVLKVGRHLTNARKRALEHIRDDTGGIMKELGGNQSSRLLLFTVRSPEDYHWPAAVEIYLEKVLKPKIRSKRTG